MAYNRMFRKHSNKEVRKKNHLLRDNYLSIWCVSFQIFFFNLLREKEGQTDKHKHRLRENYYLPTYLFTYQYINTLFIFTFWKSLISMKETVLTSFFSHLYRRKTKDGGSRFYGQFVNSPRL